MNFFRRIAGNLVGKIALSAQLIPIGDYRESSYLKRVWAKLFYTQEQVTRLNQLWEDFVTKNNEYAQTKPSHQLVIDRKAYKTPQGVLLDTIELVSLQNKDCDEYLIYGWGRSDCYEFHLNQMASDALNLRKKIISFNYRNVCHSKGQVICEQDPISDAYFQIKRLIDQGVDPKKITCYGHSMGGAIFAFAVARLHDEGYPVFLYSDRPFANLIKTSYNLYFGKNRKARKKITTVGTIALLSIGLPLLGLLAVLSWQSIGALFLLTLLSLAIQPLHTLFDKTIGTLIGRGMCWIMAYGSWEMKAAQPYEKIPQACRTHTVLRPPKKERSQWLGERCMPSNGVDKVILFEDSLHKNSPSHHQFKKRIKEEIQKIKTKPWCQTRIAKLIVLKNTLIELSNCKMSGGNHMSAPEELLTRYKDLIAGRFLNGREHFYNFVEPGHIRSKPKTYKNF